LTPGALGPFGLSAGEGRSRALVALPAAGTPEAGAIGIVPLAAGPLTVTAEVAGLARGCGREVTHARGLADAFPDNTAGTGSRALPAIWSDHADFMDKVTAIQTASTELVAATRTGDPALIQPALQAVQGTCGSCHDTYRAPAN